MIQKMKHWLPALIAVLMLLFLAMFDLLGLIDTHKSTSANFCNVILLLIALLDFFVLGLPSRANGGYDMAVFCSNIALSAIAFPMNIDIFKYTLLWEELPQNLWGWHTGWIIMMVVQILALTKIGSILLDAVKKTGNILLRIFSSLGNWMKQNKYIILLAFGGFLFWGMFSVAKCRNRSVALVFSDTDFWKSSTEIWIDYFVIVLCGYVLLVSFPKIGKAIKDMKGKTVLAAALVILIAAVAEVLPSFLKILAIVISVPAMTMGAIWVVIHKMRSKPDPNTSDPNKSDQRRGINPKDAVVMLFSFVGLPLSLLFLITLLGTTNGGMLAQDPSKITSWLDFFGSAAEVASNLFKWFT